MMRVKCHRAPLACMQLRRWQRTRAGHRFGASLFFRFQRPLT